MASQLAEMGIKCAVSVWPDVQTDAINYKNMSSRGMLIRGVDGQSKPSVQGKDYVRLQSIPSQCDSQGPL